MVILGMLDFGKRIKLKSFTKMGRSRFSVYLTGEEVDDLEFAFVLYHRLLLLFVLFVLSICLVALWSLHLRGIVCETWPCWAMDYFYCVPSTLAGAMGFYAVQTYQRLKSASKNKHL
jgi:hypothetical protein